LTVSLSRLARRALEKHNLSNITDALLSSVTPLPGKLCEQFIRCGKAGCRCREGERHGPYYYRIWRDGDRVQKVYVKREELEAVQAACDSYKDYVAALRAMRQVWLRLTRRISGECRRAQGFIR